jgi:hypothetical protein
MWTKTQELAFDIMMGLRKGLKLVRGMRRSMTEEEQQRVSGAIAEHLELANWKIERGPPSQGSARLYRPPEE